jgi:hypothetical protein
MRNQAGTFKSLQCHRHTRAPYGEHGGEKLVRELEIITIHSFVVSCLFNAWDTCSPLLGGFRSIVRKRGHGMQTYAKRDQANATPRKDYLIKIRRAPSCSSRTATCAASSARTIFATATIGRKTTTTYRAHGARVLAEAEVHEAR